MRLERHGVGLLLLTAFVFTLSGVATVSGQQAEEAAPSRPNPYRDLPWSKGPATGALGTQGTVRLPEGYAFLPQGSVAKFLEMGQNIPAGNEVGMIAPWNDQESWFVIVSYDETGYVKDDEGRSLDPDAIFRTYREGTEASNETRRKNGWATLELLGWSTPPNYEPAGHHLEFGILALSHETDGSRDSVVNHSVKVLGRQGVLEFTVIGNPTEMPSATSQVRSLLEQVSFNPGHRYAEYTQGDKVAAVGLTGLILGGAAVAATKSGLLTKLLKPLLLAGAALAAAALRHFRKLFGGSSESSGGPTA